MFKHLVALAMVGAVCASHAQSNIVSLTTKGATPAATSNTLIQSDLIGAARMIVPPDWKGFVKAGIDLKRASVADIQTGEAWQTAFDRWLGREGLQATMDWEKKYFYLEAAQKVNAVLTSQAAIAIPVAVKAQQAPQAAPAVSPNTWDVSPSDGNLSTALIRWAREAKQELMYEAPEDLPAIKASYPGDFFAALDQVLSDTANGPYPLFGCRYDNVVRILHTSQACDR